MSFCLCSGMVGLEVDIDGTAITKVTMTSSASSSASASSASAPSSASLVTSENDTIFSVTEVAYCYMWAPGVAWYICLGLHL